MAARGFRALVAIADVSFYVRPGGALDRDGTEKALLAAQMQAMQTQMTPVEIPQNTFFRSRALHLR